MTHGVDIDSEQRATIYDLLLDQFGLQAFRPLQREVIECVLTGNNAFAILPTGGGKSLCYQLPALMLPGITLVISPLISLMKDQVDSLVSRGIPAVAVNSQDTLTESHRKLADIEAGQIRIVYVAPERLKNASFVDVVRRVGASLLAVDEAHCVSQWGHDFRPDYRFIKDFHRVVGNPPLLALTATATRRVQKDIVTHLGIDGAQGFIAGVDRPNLWLGLEHCATMAEKRGKVAALAARAKGSVVIYVSSRKDADEFAALLEASLGEPVAAYHAGLLPDMRTAIQNRFMSGLIRVVTATNAFGMGIDKPDIRAVIHAGVPESMEAYFQEIGRAGRDGEPAECTLVVTPGRDIKLRQFLLEKDEPSIEQVRSLLRLVATLAQQGEGVVVIPEGQESVGSLILSYLQAAGRLEFVQRTSSGMYVTAVQALDSEAEGMVWNEIQRHMRMKKEQFRHVRNFVYLDTCRRRYLMDYFGEDLPSQSKPECCSICYPKPVVALLVPRVPQKRDQKRHEVVEVESANPELLRRLKEWRRKQAEERSVPAYVIFGDKDLAGVAVAAPRNLNELAACRGVGPTKLQLYGAKILSVVAEVTTDEQRLAREAALLFEAGQTSSQAASQLACEETVAWSLFLKWVAGTSSDMWKQQVRRFLAPNVYVAIRTELRRRLHEPFTVVSKELQKQYSHSEISLTRAVMDRVGER